MFPIRGDGFVIERPDDRTLRLVTYRGDDIASVKEQELQLPGDERGARFLEACRGYALTLTAGDVETLMPSDLFPTALLNAPIEDFARVLAEPRARQILFMDTIPAVLLATIGRPLAPMLREPVLEARIVETDQRDAFGVYGDWLTERGDPRGELVAIQLAREVNDTPELAAREAELLFEYAFEWLGGYAWRPELKATFRRGFIHRIDAGDVYLGGLDEVPHRALLRELDVKPPEWSTVELLERAYPHLTMLHRLRIEARDIDLGAIDLPSLRDLELVTRSLTVDNLASLREAKWPQLRRLVLWLGDYEVDDCDVTLDDLDWILAGEGLATVRELGLCGREPAQLLERIVAAPILAQLETLDLAGSFLDDASIQFVADHTSAFAHLREVRFPPPLMRRDPSVVARLLPNGIVDDRFIPVYE
jgi:uncharacterized protein (TIGR02996 family)